MVNEGPIKQESTPRPSYKYLVVSALPQELQAFYSINDAFSNRIRIDKELGVYQTKLKIANSEETVLTFTSGIMGMPHNSAAIMQVIERHQPIYVLFIGTCASLKDGAKLGTVIIPKSVFNYELGKLKSLSFASDHESYKMSKTIPEHAESIISTNPTRLNFPVVTDDDFCSGSIVVDSGFKKWWIKKRASRKVNGLDMESYSLGAIQHLNPSKIIGVVKGVMDLGTGKTDENKATAMKNAGKFAYELICYIEAEDERLVAALNGGQ
jgi:nucleoside phosphorylase